MIPSIGMLRMLALQLGTDIVASLIGVAARARLCGGLLHHMRGSDIPEIAFNSMCVRLTTISEIMIR